MFNIRNSKKTVSLSSRSPSPPNGGRRGGGQTFTVLHFDTEVIPLRSGSLALGPASLRLKVLTRRRGGSSFGDPFFDRFFQNDFFSTFSSERRRLTLRSEPLTLSVQPLAGSR